jgi:hypothetical protein
MFQHNCRLLSIKYCLSKNIISTKNKFFYVYLNILNMRLVNKHKCKYIRWLAARCLLSHIKHRIKISKANYVVLSLNIVTDVIRYFLLKVGKRCSVCLKMDLLFSLFLRCTGNNLFYKMNMLITS